MKALKWIVLLSLLSLFAAVGCRSVDLPHSDPAEGRHILLGEEDFSAIGNAITVITPILMTEQQTSLPVPGLLSAWTEATATTLMVQPGETERNNAIVNVSSYKFASAQTARDQLETVTIPLQAAGMQAVTDAGALLDAESTDLLTERSTTWHIKTGRDDENLLVYFLWVQADTYIMETQITVDERNEQLGQDILHHVIQHVLTQEVSA